MEERFDIAVVGGGIAGYSAALTLKSLRASYLWLGEEGFGEKLSSAEYVRNFPAVTGSGAQFSALLKEQMSREGVVLTPARVDGIYQTDEGYLLTVGERSFFARAVILASGVELAGSVKGEREFLGRGVSYCAVCDGALYKGKQIAVVVSSPRFLEEAEYLASFARTVYAISREKLSYSAENILPVSDIPLAVEGATRVERLVCKNQTYEVDGVFFLKNATPPSALVGGLETEGAHVKVSRGLESNLKGLFAAGDVAGKPYQYVKAAGEGNAAAYAAVAYLKSLQGGGV